jgi:hypothetical protein
MNPTRHFAHLHSKAVGKSTKLRGLATYACTLPLLQSDPIMSYVVINLQTVLSIFSRAYFLSYTLNPFLRDGSRVSCDPSVTTFSHAIDIAMRSCKYKVWATGGWTRRDEPPWNKPDTLTKSCNAIGCSYQPQIIAAFSVPTSAFDDIPKFRNFYAHRNDYTVGFAQNVATRYSISPRQHPTAILASVAYHRPQPLILDWIDDFINVIDLLC